MAKETPLPSVFNYDEENQRNKSTLYDSVCVLRHMIFLLLYSVFKVRLPPELNPAPDSLSIQLIDPSSLKHGFNFTTGNTERDWRLDCTIISNGRISFCLLQYVEKEERWVWLYPNGLRPSGEKATEYEGVFMTIEEFQSKLPMIVSVMKNVPVNAS